MGKKVMKPQKMKNKDLYKLFPTAKTESFYFAVGLFEGLYIIGVMFSLSKTTFVTQLGRPNGEKH